MSRRVVSFAGTAIAVEHEGAVGARVVELLLSRLAAADGGAVPKVTLTLRSKRDDSTATLLLDGDVVVSDADAGLLVEHMEERLAYHFADGCHDGLIVHAGAVAREGRAICFPAQSGSGKSTLTAWLMTRGFAHLTDELVHLSERDACVHGWMRPIGLKQGSLSVIEPHLRMPKGPGAWLETPLGAVLAPQLLSSQPSVASALAWAVVFPRFESGRGAPLARPLSAAETSAWLLRCTLNARHLPAHGLRAAAAFCRRVPGFELVYGSFDALEELLGQWLERPSAAVDGAGGVDGA